jgi:uncharacterized protein (DUF952 family)
VKKRQKKFSPKNPNVPPKTGFVHFSANQQQRIQNENLFTISQNLELLQHFNVKYLVSTTPLFMKKLEPFMIKPKESEA